VSIKFLDVWGQRLVAGVLRYIPHGGLNPPGGKDLHPPSPIPKGFMANGGYTIQGEDVLEVLSKAGGAGSKGWPLGC
jgi:hypothetical protein